MQNEKNFQDSDCPGSLFSFPPLELKKVHVLADLGYDGFPSVWVPVRVFVTPAQLSEIIRLRIDLTGVIQNWLDDDIEVYREAANQ